jgi:peroxiredoxin
MRYFLISILCYVAMISCQQPGSNKVYAVAKDSVYTITGKIDGIDSGWVYLLHRQSAAEAPDSAQVTNGYFNFRGKATVPEFCLLGITNNGNKEYRLGFFLENGQLHISGKKDSVSNALITGSAVQDEYKSFIASRKPLDEEGDKLETLYESSKNDKRLTDSLQKIFEIYGQKEKDFVRDYAKQHPSSYVAASQVYQNFSYNPEAKQLESIYASFDPVIKDSYFGKKIKDVLDIAKKTAIGNHAPDFNLNDADGKPVALSSFRGKYVLVDFWASWCGPCRQENPAVVKAYQQYHHKGFDILGVSLDDEKEAWVKAIKKDNLNWSHVSDLKGWKNSAAELYGVQAIPMNFLLDKEGNIVGKGLRGDKLEEKLAEVMK